MKTPNKKMRFISLLVIFILAVMIAFPAPITAAAELPVNLRSTASFAVLAGTAITDADGGNTQINGEAGGNVGLSPAAGSNITGLKPANVSGTIYAVDDTGPAGSAGVAPALLIQAKQDLQLAYDDAADRTGAVNLSGQDLGGQILTPGVYSFNSSAQLTGTLTLDAQGDPDGVFIFQIGSTLTTAPDSKVILSNGARCCRIFWQVGSSATLDTYSDFVGHIFARGSITANTGAQVQGQLLALDYAVTMDNNVITNPISLPAATLTVIKEVVNNYDGAAVASDFSLSVETAAGEAVYGSPQPGDEDGTIYKLLEGDYVVSEVAVEGYSVSYSGGNGDGTITLAPGVTETITVTNNDIPPPNSAELTVIKQVINDDGRSAAAGNFNLYVKTGGIDIDGSPAQGVELPGRTYENLAAGTYVVSEDAVAGYTVSYSVDGLESADGTVTLANGESKTVIITNNDNPVPVVPPQESAELTVIKHVYGGPALASDFRLYVKTGGINVAGSPADGVEAPGKTYDNLTPGTYVVSEDAVEGYTASYSGDSDASGIVTLAAGDSKTVTITNTFGNDEIPPPQEPATLRVIKRVINNSGRNAEASDFSLHVKADGSDVAGSPADGNEVGTVYTLPAGAYVVSEDNHSGYDATYSGDSDAGGNITLEPGDSKTVTITNNDRSSGGGGGGGGTTTTATLRVIKHVINDDGRSEVADDFNLHVKNAAGDDVAASPAPGAESPGKTYRLPAGTYTISEDAHSGYTATYSGDSNSSGKITLAAGDNKTVTITNNDIAPPVVDSSTPATLRVIKNVINDNGRTAVAADFSLRVKNADGSDVAASPAPGAGSPGNTYTLPAGTYIISEDAHPGYTVSYGGGSDAGGRITLAAGDNKTVTVTNDDIAAQIVTTTVSGGQLPATSTPLYELLLIGIALSLAGAVAWRSRKRYE